MKNIFTLFLSVLPFLFFSQATPSINYQGVARDANGILVNKPIGLQFIIHQYTVNGISVLSETHAVTTNAFGLFNVAIGSNSGSAFINIPWANGPFFIETLIDPTGGTSYISLGTEKFRSVPYALYAEKAGNAVPTFSINTPHSVITNSVTNSHTITIAAPTLPTYGLTQSSGSINLTQNGTTISTVPVSSTPQTTITSSNNNVSISSPSTNSFIITSVTPTLNVIGGSMTGSYPNQTLTIPTASTTILTASTNIVLSGSAPNYTISSPSQLLSISGNSLSISSGNSINIPTPILTYTAGVTSSTLQSGNPANSVVIPNYILSNTTNTIILSNGVSTTSVIIPSPPISYTNSVLSVGSSTANIPALWTESVTVLSPTNLADNVNIGSNSNTGGKFEIEHNASASAPSIHLKQPTTGLNRIKLSNLPILGKFWEIASQTAPTPSNSALSFNHFDGSNYKSDLIVYEDGKVQVHNLNTALASFHVSDIANTSSNGIASEGFGQQGQLTIARANYSGPLNAPVRTNVQAGEELGRINFSGFNGSIYRESAKIYVKSLNAFNGLNSGADLFFATTLDNNITALDRMVILNNGNVGIGTNSPLSMLDINSNPNIGGINVLSNSSSMPTISAKNDGFGASLFANKLAGTGYVARLENQNAGNSLSTIYGITNSSNSVTAVAELRNNGGGSAINAYNNNANVATLNATNNGGGLAGIFNGGLNVINGFITITDGTQANGKILMSDANGKAAWKTSPATVYFGNLNTTSTTVSTTPSPLGAASMSINKQYGNSEIVIDVNTMIDIGSGTSPLYVQVYVDGSSSPLSSIYITGQVTGIPEYMSIHAVFQGLSIGLHNITIVAKTTSGSRSNVTLDPGGFGGILTAKEQL